MAATWSARRWLPLLLSPSEVVIDAAHRDVQADLEMMLLSRAQQATPANAQQAMAAALASAGAAGANGRGFQSLALTQSEGAEGQGA